MVLELLLFQLMFQIDSNLRCDMIYDFKISADYFQIYLEDSSAIDKDQFLWTDENIKNMFYSSRYLIVIGTVRDLEVPISIEICKTKPSLDFDVWDQINECGIDIASGNLFISGTTDFIEDFKRINLEPGLYGALLCYRGLNTISDDGLSGDDYYKVYLWKEAKLVPSKVLKQH